VSAIDLPPGIGLAGTPLGIFTAPPRARRLATIAMVVVVALGALTWYFVLRHPVLDASDSLWQAGSVKIVVPVALALLAGLGWLVRSAHVAVTRDGVRWGWAALGFHQEASRIVQAHVYRDGVALEARRGSWWFLAARDWDRFDALVRQLRRAELPIADHAGRAPLRARLQSYGRFLDAMMLFAIVVSIGVAMWAA
jgi:hypothetical protein